MRKTTRWIGAAVATVVLAATVTACGGRDKDSGKSDPGEGGGRSKLTIGIKFDQPGLGLKDASGKYTGFDVEVAKYVAKELGVDESKITWKEAQSAERESLIEKGEVDFIVATYSINDERKKKVDFVGPYFVAHQDLLVRSGDDSIKGPESLNNGKKLCSVKGSTPAQNVKTKYANKVQLQEYGKYSDCVTALMSGAVDAVTTDDVILAGYAAQPQYKGKLKLVGKGFTDENYGIGLKKGDTKLHDDIATAVKQMIEDGSWKKALDNTVGPSGYTIPQPPSVT